jgi:hypothetical protein
VTEFRQGAGGGNDTYVELYNTGPAAPLAGFALSAFSGTVTTLPSTAGILPTGRYFLVTGTIYSHGAVTAADHVSSTLGTGGVRVLAPDTAGTRIDAAGPTSGYHLGTGLTEMTTGTTGTTGWAWARLQLAGAPRNTSDNASDFWLVYRSTTLIRGMQPTVGGSSPSNTTSPPPQNAGLQSTLLDPAVNASVEPNRAYTPAGAGGSPPGTLTIRRTVTNSTALAVSSLTIRVTALSQAFGAPLPGVATQPATHANLRVREPATTTSTVAMSNGTTVSVTNATINDPNLTTVGAGLNRALTVNLPDPLAPAASINVAVHFTVQTVGRFWFGYDVEAALTTPVLTNAAPTRQHSLLTGPRRSPHRISTLTTGQLRNETPPRPKSQAWAASGRR